jgi:hypothetical protein
MRLDVRILVDVRIATRSSESTSAPWILVSQYNPVVAQGIDDASKISIFRTHIHALAGQIPNKGLYIPTDRMRRIATFFLVCR